MTSVNDIGTESKRALLRDAPDLAARAVSLARWDPDIRDVLKDYETVCQQMGQTARNTRLDRGLGEIRDELIAELRRRLARRASEPAAETAIVEPVFNRSTEE